MSQPAADLVERASRLKQEASFVLEEVGLYDILSSYGQVVPTGSYFLDLMMYPDIDVYLPPISIAEIFEIGGRLANAGRVYEVVFAKSRLQELPGSLYLKARIEYGDWGRPWKIDIWSIENEIIESKMVDLQRFKEKMDPQLREQILRYKYSILTEEGRTPMYSGYFVCKAFIDKGMSDPQDVTCYLRDCGIQVP